MPRLPIALLALLAFALTPLVGCPPADDDDDDVADDDDFFGDDDDFVDDDDISDDDDSASDDDDSAADDDDSATDDDDDSATDDDDDSGATDDDDDDDSGAADDDDSGSGDDDDSGSGDDDDSAEPGLPLGAVCAEDNECESGVCWDFADYDPWCGGAVCSITCVTNLDCELAFGAAGAPDPAGATCGYDLRCDPVGSGIGAFWCA
jgi:hypothetical protein